jgi:hypothetical protein
MDNIECRFSTKCTSHPDKCGSCLNNRGKRDYYRPEPYPWWPWWHWPYWEPRPYQPGIWYCTSGNSQDNPAKQDYYITSQSVSNETPVSC